MEVWSEGRSSCRSSAVQRPSHSIYSFLPPRFPLLHVWGGHQPVVIVHLLFSTFVMSIMLFNKTNIAMRTNTFPQLTHSTHTIHTHFALYLVFDANNCIIIPIKRSLYEVFSLQINTKMPPIINTMHYKYT